MNESNFQHILRVLNTNLDGKVKVMFALTNIKGVGRRFSNIACKKAEVDLNKRCAPPLAAVIAVYALGSSCCCHRLRHSGRRRRRRACRLSTLRQWCLLVPVAGCVCAGRVS